MNDDFYDAITNRFVGEDTMLDRVMEYGQEYLEALERGDLDVAEAYQAALETFESQSDAVYWDAEPVTDDAEAVAEEEEDYGEISDYFGEADDLLDYLDFDTDHDEAFGEYEFSFEYEETT